MRKDERKAREPKGVYRVRDWSEYNAGLIARGNVAMWIDESVLTDPSEPGTRKRGRPRIYADAVIQMLLGLKQVFRLPLRALQGFAQGLYELGSMREHFPGRPVFSRAAKHGQSNFMLYTSGG